MTAPTGAALNDQHGGRKLNFYRFRRTILPARTAVPTFIRIFDHWNSLLTVTCGIDDVAHANVFTYTATIALIEINDRRHYLPPSVAGITPLSG